MYWEFKIQYMNLREHIILNSNTPNRENELSDWQVKKLCHPLVISHPWDCGGGGHDVGWVVSSTDPNFSMGQSQGLHWQDSAMSLPFGCIQEAMISTRCCQR